MNKKGFTLVELIAVIALIALVSMLTFPVLSNIRSNNNEKEFTTYQDMMVQYAKTIPNSNWIRLSDNEYYICLNNLGIKKINEKMNCNGYVGKNNNTLIPYLYCKDANNNDLYKTSGYNKPNNC